MRNSYFLTKINMSSLLLGYKFPSDVFFKDFAYMKIFLGDTIPTLLSYLSSPASAHLSDMTELLSRND